MKRILSIRNWDILTRNMPLAVVAIFVGVFAYFELPPDSNLNKIFTLCGLWGSFSLVAIQIESSDPQKFPGIWQRMPNWTSIMLIWMAIFLIISYILPIIIRHALE